MIRKFFCFLKSLFHKTPKVFLESRTVTIKEGERLIAQGEGWEYAGYGLGESMNIARLVDEQGNPTGGKVFIT